jgi:hypothetical protein
MCVNLIPWHTYYEYSVWVLKLGMTIPVHPRREMSTHYFSCLGGSNVASIKSALGHVMLNLDFFIQCYLRVTWCIPMRPGHKTSMQYFSCSGGCGAVSIKSAPGHDMPKVCFCNRCYLWVM